MKDRENKERVISFGCTPGLLRDIEELAEPQGGAQGCDGPPIEAAGISRRLLTAAGRRVAVTLSERGELSGDEIDALIARPSRPPPWGNPESF
jgi:hypothetical protein